MNFRAVFALLSLFSASQVLALPANAGTWLTTGQGVVPPAGFIHFCVKHLQECRISSEDPVRIQLGPDRRRELEEVQTRINQAIVPRVDPTHDWDYSQDGHGECNQYALGKRRELIERGWPRQSLRLATATTETGEGHLVLVVHTSEGDLVLDNRLPKVVDWSVLPYRWISMQSPTNAVRWVSIIAQPVVVSDASLVLNQQAVATR